jgi:hypothetical protein
MHLHLPIPLPPLKHLLQLLKFLLLKLHDLLPHLHLKLKPRLYPKRHGLVK